MINPRVAKVCLNLFMIGQMRQLLSLIQHVIHQLRLMAKPKVQLLVAILVSSPNLLLVLLKVLQILAKNSLTNLEKNLVIISLAILPVSQAQGLKSWVNKMLLNLLTKDLTSLSTFLTWQINSYMTQTLWKTNKYLSLNLKSTMKDYYWQQTELTFCQLKSKRSQEKANHGLELLQIQQARSSAQNAKMKMEMIFKMAEIPGGRRKSHNNPTKKRDSQQSWNKQLMSNCFCNREWSKKHMKKCMKSRVSNASKNAKS